MNATAGELSLAVTLRETALKAHNATRERDRLPPLEFNAWRDIPIDQREAWVAVARHVESNFARKNVDPEQLVRAATLELCSTVGGLLDRKRCEQIARAVLAIAGLIQKPQ